MEKPLYYPEPTSKLEYDGKFLCNGNDCSFWLLKVREEWTIYKIASKGEWDFYYYHSIVKDAEYEPAIMVFEKYLSLL